jgi:23S rRNA pseudouridine1911/1915/1917 synthase
MAKHKSPELDDADDELSEQELFEHLKIKVDKGQTMLRIDKFLFNHIQNATRSKIQKAADNGCIRVNGKPVKSNYRIKPLDEITVLLPNPPREFELQPEDIPLNIVFEDDDIIIVNKAPGMVVHPGFGNYSSTLINALLYHFKNLPQPKNKSNDPHADMRPGLVHRIDKFTSGLLVIAKTEDAHVKLSKLFFDRNIDRKYVALVWGDVKADEGTITGNIGRSIKDRKIRTVFADGTMGKHAITHYKVIERFGYVTLVECKLETGRTHQIRVHMQYIGHPLFNDIEYGGDTIIKGTTFTKYKQFVENCFSILPRHALHAQTLGFVHPSSGKEIKFDSDIPDDMAAAINKWRDYAKNVIFKKGDIEE